MAINSGYEMDWDSTIENDEQPEFTVLEEGDYNFTIEKIERGIVGENSEKYAGMKMATVYFDVPVAGTGESVQIRENFILHSNFAWKIGAMLVSVGLKKKGEAISGNYWNKLPGSSGRFHVVKTQSNKDKTKFFNNIKTFHEPSAVTGGDKWAL